MLFLSATPVHLGSQNLYTLLTLLRPDFFLDETVFEEVVKPNRHITQAMRHLRNRTPQDAWQLHAATALGDAVETLWGKHVLSWDPRLLEWHRRLQNEGVLCDADRVRSLRDLEDLHSLAHVMNHTRRRDIRRFTIREPHTISVQFTPAQQRFYEAIIDFRQDMLSLDYDPRVVV